jgi:transcriptional regulator
MYNPAHFNETRPEILHALMREHPLGALVTLGSTGLDANHIPFEFDPTPTAESPCGTLRAHVARANPVWQDFSRAHSALVIFQGPQAYISPSWYESKREHGKVVPTFNYCVVHAHGALRAIDDPAWLHAMVTRLTARHESTRPGRQVESQPEPR